MGAIDMSAYQLVARTPFNGYLLPGMSFGVYAASSVSSIYGFLDVSAVVSAGHIDTYERMRFNFLFGPGPNAKKL